MAFGSTAFGFEQRIDETLAAGPWAQSDAEKRLLESLDAAAEQIQALSADGYADMAGEEDRQPAHPVLTETALLLLAAHIAAGSFDQTAAKGGIRRRILSLAEQLKPLARGSRVLLSLVLQPARALDFALPHICLTRLGYPDLRCDRLLHETLWNTPQTAQQCAPLGQLRHEWLLWMGSVSSNPHGRQDAAASLLARPLDLLHTTRQEALVFCQALQLATDFNCLPIPLPRSKDELLAEAGAVLARCLDDNDFDLAAQVLSVWPLVVHPFPEKPASAAKPPVGCAWSAAAAFGLDVLRRVEDQTGPRTANGFVWSAALMPGACPPENIPVAPAGLTGAAHALLQHLDAEARQAIWFQEFQVLDPEQQDSLAGLLLDIALLRKLKQKDYPGLALLFLEAGRLQLPHSPLAAQAAHLLNRLQVFNEILAQRRPTSPFPAVSRAFAA
ncbi:MAG: hypothetical protein NW208_15565 [Bryobacter sp.]|nr:hypothetical protein [Bryobacter sp.]